MSDALDTVFDIALDIVLDTVLTEDPENDPGCSIKLDDSLSGLITPISYVELSLLSRILALKYIYSIAISKVKKMTPEDM